MSDRPSGEGQPPRPTPPTDYRFPAGALGSTWAIHLTPNDKAAFLTAVLDTAVELGVPLAWCKWYGVEILVGAMQRLELAGWSVMHQSRHDRPALGDTPLPRG